MVGLYKYVLISVKYYDNEDGYSDFKREECVLILVPSPHRGHAHAY